MTLTLLQLREMFDVPLVSLSVVSLAASSPGVARV